MKLIDKDKVVAEIKRLIDRSEYSEVYDYAFRDGNNAVCVHILNFLDTLETKEVNLKKEIYDAQKRFGDIDEMGGYKILIYDDEFRDVLNHFYELGLNAKK